MPLIGIIGNKKDIQNIKKKISIKNNEIEIIEINRQSIKNLKNIKFDEIIFLKDINLEKEEYTFMENIISKIQYLIINADINMTILEKIKTEHPIKLITFGFNLRSTITISSVKDEKIMICLQRNIRKNNNELIETQEREIEINLKNDKKIYNEIIIFIIKELHNLI